MVLTNEEYDFFNKIYPIIDDGQLTPWGRFILEGELYFDEFINVLDDLLDTLDDVFYYI